MDLIGLVAMNQTIFNGYDVLISIVLSSILTAGILTVLFEVCARSKETKHWMDVRELHRQLRELRDARKEEDWI